MHKLPGYKEVILSLKEILQDKRRILLLLIILFGTELSLTPATAHADSILTCSSNVSFLNANSPTDIDITLNNVSSDFYHNVFFNKIDLNHINVTYNNPLPDTYNLSFSGNIDEFTNGHTFPGDSQTWHVTFTPTQNLSQSDLPEILHLQLFDAILQNGNCDLSFNIAPSNTSPQIGSLSGVTLNEGGTYAENGSFTDADSTSWTGTVDYGDGSGAQPLTLSGNNFFLNHSYSSTGTYTVTVSITDNQGATATTNTTILVKKQLVSLNPAKVWIGLKNSDDVGLKFDVKAEVYKDSSLVTSGEIDSVVAGSSGFNNAKLDTISFNSFSPIDFPSGSQLKMEVYVRNACSGSGHNSGTARLWYNDSAANSQFGATIGAATTNYFLGDTMSLLTSVASGPKKTIDIQSGAKCSAFKPFGTWSINL